MPEILDTSGESPAQMEQENLVPILPRGDGGQPEYEYEEDGYPDAEPLSAAPSPFPVPSAPIDLSPAEEEKVIRDTVKKQVRQERIVADAREEAEDAEDDEEDDDPSSVTAVTAEDMEEIAGVSNEDVLGVGGDEPDDFSDITSISDEEMDEIAGVDPEDVTGAPPKKRRPPRRSRLTPRGEQFGGVGRVGY